MLVNECRRRKLNGGAPEKCRKLQRCVDRMFYQTGALPQSSSLVGDEDDCQWGIGTHSSHFLPPTCHFAINLISITHHERVLRYTRITTRLRTGKRIEAVAYSWGLRTKVHDTIVCYKVQSEQVIHDVINVRV